MHDGHGIALVCTAPARGFDDAEPVFREALDGFRFPGKVVSVRGGQALDPGRDRRASYVGRVLVVTEISKCASHATEARRFRDGGLPAPSAFAYGVGVVELVAE